MGCYINFMECIQCDLNSFTLKSSVVDDICCFELHYLYLYSIILMDMMGSEYQHIYSLNQ